MTDFSTKLIQWHEDKGRKNLPWQKNPNPYKVWISEVMLQQTQVSTVIPYFKKFIKTFPNIKKLSESDLDKILVLWSGLGYYARARNIYKASQIINNDYGGKVPNTLKKLMSLPGIGKSTAGAILVFGYKKRSAILDGNVKRVLTRYFKIEKDLSLTSTTNYLWKISESLIPKHKVDIYTQSIMDLGATVCTKNNPNCKNCPINKSCLALQEGLAQSLPFIRKPKKKPTKKVLWLLPRSPKGDLLMYKRKDKRLWGELWSFIDLEGEKKEIIEHEVQRRFLVKNPKLKKLNKVKHSFSHYNLEAIPYLAELETKKSYKNAVWVNPKNVKSLALPGPVKELFITLQNYENC